jgi:hypothetical protein
MSEDDQESDETEDDVEKKKMREMETREQQETGLVSCPRE